LLRGCFYDAAQGYGIINRADFGMSEGNSEIFLSEQPQFLRFQPFRFYYSRLEKGKRQGGKGKRQALVRWCL
jgi:hypothetical protein